MSRAARVRRAQCFPTCGRPRNSAGKRDTRRTTARPENAATGHAPLSANATPVAELMPPSQHQSNKALARQGTMRQQGRGKLRKRRLDLGPVVSLLPETPFCIGKLYQADKPWKSQLLPTRQKRLRPSSSPPPRKPEGEGGASLLTPAQIHEVFSRFAAAMPHPKTELEHVNPVHAAGCGRAFGAGDGCGRQQGDEEPVQDGGHAAKDAGRLARRSSATPSRPSASSTPRPKT